ncbi:hypothetical protein F2Q70_00002953 [Brassica cretica]|uniref:Uncharacterized protein n=1 Tax=Brassica cretica TaxID=69181 RepID=A0A8S9IZJ8_BRACR|nr:hypothetical protein F2Q70_00002953 [Brassica cretica]
MRECSSVSWAKLGQAQCSSLKCRSAPAAGLLSQSAGTAGDHLNSARWSVGSSDHWVVPGSYRAGWSGLTVPGCLVTAIGERVQSVPLFKSMARIDTEGMQWLRCNHPFFYKRQASPSLCRHARASSYTLKHKEKQRKDRELVGFNIQPQEWCDGHKEAVLGDIKGEVMNDPLMGFDSCRNHPRHPPGPENTRK